MSAIAVIIILTVLHLTNWGLAEWRIRKTQRVVNDLLNNRTQMVKAIIDLAELAFPYDPVAVNLVLGDLNDKSERTLGKYQKHKRPATMGDTDTV